jgi:hypothetical protein
VVLASLLRRAPSIIKMSWIRWNGNGASGTSVAGSSSATLTVVSSETRRADVLAPTAQRSQLTEMRASSWLSWGGHEPVRQHGSGEPVIEIHDPAIACDQSQNMARGR